MRLFSGTASNETSALSGLSEGFGLGSAPPESDPLIGLTVDGFRIVRLVGVGGMGRVYEAIQSKPQRIVAIKFVRPELISARLIKRFEYEAELLGQLQHPGIAHIYSVGVHQVGETLVPYFVMEFIVDARPLTHYADAFGLSTRQRLDLFQKVCVAVAHGHQRGVIHRDLKPGNILVDGTGTPKVIDFGVARTTDADLAITTIQTDIGQLVGTLPYMSPEQLAGTPNDLDVRADVYALGVILYELLTGQLPYDVRRKAVHEVIRVVREEEPTPITGLNHSLRREVGVIAGTCLGKSPNSRYSSAAELAADIGRYLKGEPILAAAPSFWDGVVRLGHRHKSLAAAAIVGLATLVAALVVISVFAVRVHTAKQVAIQAEQEAIVQRVKAERARARAEAEQRRTKQRLYAALLTDASHFANSDQRSAAQRVLDAAAEIFTELNGEAAALPPEIQILASSLDDSIATLVGHRAGITAMAIDPTGGVFATAAYDQTIRIWNGKTNTCINVFESTAPVKQLAFSSDGEELVALTSDGVVGRWHLPTGQSHNYVPDRGDTFTCLAVSPTEKKIVAGTQRGVVCVWDSLEEQIAQEYHGHTGRVTSVAFHPGGREVATGSEDGTVRIWQTATGNPVRKYLVDSAVAKVLYSPAADRLAAASRDWRVRVWDLARDDHIVVRLKSAVRDVSFVLNGRRLVTVSEIGDAVLWDAATGRQRQRLGEYSSSMICVAAAPGHSQFATGSRNGGVSLWDAETGSLLGVLTSSESGIHSIAFLPGRLQLLAAGYSPVVNRWAYTDVGELGVLAYRERKAFSSCVFSLDGLRLATASPQRGVSIWDADTGMHIAGIPNSGGATVVAVTPDESLLVAGRSDGTLLVWDAATGMLQGQYPVHDAAVSSLAISLQNDFVVTGSVDNTAQVWDPRSGKVIASLPGQGVTVQSVAVSPDGRLVAVGSGGQPTVPGVVQIWELPTKRMVQKLTTGYYGPTSALCFSPDGTQLATGTGSGVIFLFDPVSGNQYGQLSGHTERVSALRFSGDGSRLLSASRDGSARLWDPMLRIAVGEFVGHQRKLGGAALSSDGRRIATASYDGFVRIWGITGQEIFRQRADSRRNRQRSEPFVNEWFQSGVTAVGQHLQAARGTMSAAAWREAANLVLIQGIRRSNRQSSED